MLVLLTGECILFQKECSITLRYKTIKDKREGKGILYITNLRVAFEDHKHGILMQVFPSQYELQAYRRVKNLFGEKLALDIEKSGNSTIPTVTATAELEFKDRRAVREAEYALNTLLNSSNNIQYLPDKDISNNSDNNNRLTASGSPISSNYTMSMDNNNNLTEEGEERMPEEYKKWISDIRFTWDPDKRIRELGYIMVSKKQYEWYYFSNALLHIDSTIRYMKIYFDTNKFSNDFRYKVAREAYKLIAVTPQIHVRDLKKKDTNVYWVGIIENAYKDGTSELVGVNVNAHADCFFILNPIHWYRRFKRWVEKWYNIEYDRPFSTFYLSERDKDRTITLANACKDFYYSILNKDFKKAEEAWKVISETYKKYGSEIEYAGYTGEYGLLLRYAMEMHARNIPFPTVEKKTPI